MSADDVQDRLWGALRARPGSTATDLASEAKIGYSTTARLLGQWAGEASVTSEPGATARAARRWTAVPSQIPILPTTPSAATDDMNGSDGVAANATDGASTVEAEPVDRAGADTSDAVPADAPPTVTAAEAASDAQPEVSATSPADGHDGANRSSAARRPAEPSRNRSGSVRLQAGALRGMVEDFLAERGAGEYSPVDIGNALSRSPGAVANALEKLVEDGTVVRTSERPRGYRHADADADEVVLTDDEPDDPQPDQAEGGGIDGSGRATGLASSTAAPCSRQLQNRRGAGRSPV